jgi:Tol biopolymer transport system component
MPGDQEVRAASWSPDGQSIALIQCDVDDCALWVMDRDGSHLRRIPTQITNTTWDVDWTPDGLRLVFISDEGISIVWSVRLDGTDLRPIIYDASMPRDLCEP